MDLHMLSLLPDAAKLGILRHLGVATASSTQQPRQPQGASPPPPTQEGQQHGLQHPVVPHGMTQTTVPEVLVGRRLEGGLAVIDGFLSSGAVQAARAEAQQVLQQQARQAAGMVSAASAAASSTGGTWKSSASRGDRAAWLSPAALQAEGHSQLLAAAKALLSLQPWLEQQGYDVGGRPSIQLACYPGGGARYVRHRDASASVPYRSVTAILYLNPDWQAAHGGSLCVYNHSTVGSDPCAASPADLTLGSAAAAAAAAAAATSSSTGKGSNEGASRAKDGALGEGVLPAAAAAVGAGATAAGAGAAAAGAGAGAGAGAQQQGGQQQREQKEQKQAQGGPAIGSGLDEGHPAMVVGPLGGRLVVMDSRLLHEVLPAQADRLAVTVWFSRTPQPLPPRSATAPASAAAKDASAAEDTPVAAAAAALKAAAISSRARAQQQGQQGQQGQHQPAAQQPPLPAHCLQPQAAGPALDAAAISAPGLIFVSVPAYRDSEARWTLADLFSKASNPERVRVGIVWQVELPQDAPLMALNLDRRWLRQVRQVVLPASEATGPCKARALAQQLWEGEEFHLQVDSHMRFVPGWDDALLRMLRQAEAAAGHPRVVLSSYPPGYEGEGVEAVLPAEPLPTVLCASHWGQADGLLRISGRKLSEPLPGPVPALFWAAGLSFSRAQLIQEAPYPRDLPWLFFGEEMLQLQRMWCTGWDVFAPPAAVAFHQWSRSHRPTFRQDPPPEAERQRLRSQQRVAADLAGQGGQGGGKGQEQKRGQDGTPDGSVAGSCSGGSGTGAPPCIRSLQQFWQHVGVDFRPGSKRISERARNGGFPPEALLCAGAWPAGAAS